MALKLQVGFLFSCGVFCFGFGFFVGFLFVGLFWVSLFGFVLGGLFGFCFIGCFLKRKVDEVI